MIFTTTSEIDKNPSKKEEWINILIGTLITFLCTVESNIIGIGEWPYMEQLDHESTSSFFGIATSAGRFGHALFAFIFAFWAHKTGKIRMSLLLGRMVTLIACVIYLFIEYIPFPKRFALLFCYFLFGIGFSTYPLLRGYIARVSSDSNRSSAYALLNTSMIMSIIIGPVAQLSLSSVSYPGFEIIPNVRLHIYSAPIWFATITNLIVIFIVVFIFKEFNYNYGNTERITEKVSLFSIEKMKEQINAIRQLGFPWILVILIIFEKVVSNLSHSTLLVTAGPMMTSVFGKTGEETVLVMALAQCLVGIIALLLSLSFIFCKLGARISTRTLFAFSSIIIVVGYLITYPWSFIASSMPAYNETARIGCNPEEYTWCHTERVTPFFVFVGVMMIVLGFAIPSSNLSLDTIYSKILGDINQSVMQAILVVAEDIVLVIGPIYAAEVFTSYGMSMLCIINGSIFTVSTIVWFILWKKLKKYM